MNVRQLLVLAVLIPFALFTDWVLYTEGFTGFWTQALGSPVALQLTLDLVIALGLVLLWMQADARESGVPFLPYLLLTLVVGSIGPLSYLIHREARARRRVPAAVRA